MNHYCAIIQTYMLKKKIHIIVAHLDFIQKFVASMKSGSVD